MVDLMSLGDQVEKDFAVARRRARMRGFGRRLRGSKETGTLLPFERIRRVVGAAGGVRTGGTTVEV